MEKRTKVQRLHAARALHRETPAWLLHPLVSVVLPLHNDAARALDSVRSVIEKQRPPVELIVVNDGSTDDVLNLLRAFTANPHFKMISKPHEGLKAALFAGMKETSGPYITWTTARNSFAPDALHKLSSFLVSHPSVDCVYANFSLVDEGGAPLYRTGYRTADQNPMDTSHILAPYSSRSLGYLDETFIGPCFLFRREVFDLLGPYTEDDLAQDGAGYWLRLAATGMMSHVDNEDPLSFFTPRSDERTPAACRKTNHASVSWTLTGSGLSAREEEIFNAPNAGIGRPHLIVSSTRRRFEITVKKLWEPEHGRLQQVLEATPAFRLSASGPHSEHKILLYPAVKDLFLLRRARDSSFPLIPQTERRNLMLFTREEAVSESHSALREAFADCLLVPVCFSDAQAKAAESLAGAAPSCHITDLRKSEDIVISLMHALSGCDAVLSVHTGQFKLPDLFQIRLEAILAAYAGLPFLLLSTEEPRTYDEPSSSIGAPNLACIRVRDVRESGRRILAQATQGIDIQSADEWLRSTTLTALRDRVNRLVVSVMGCYNPDNS